MSSHHIIRDKQEPALLVLGLGHFTEEMLGQLLEWSPTVITTPLTAEQLNSFGIKIDCVVTDETGHVFQSDIKVISAGNLSPLDAALRYLIISGYPAVNIVTDAFQLSDFNGFVSRINLVIFLGGKKIYPVTSGFSKWKPAGELMQILSPALDVHTTGLRVLTDNNYQTIGDGFVMFEFNGPHLFIAEDFQ